MCDVAHRVDLAYPPGSSSNRNVRSDLVASNPARVLASVLEPVTGQVYFSPEAHAAYEALGFGASPGTTGTGVALPDGPAYFTSRGSVMGQVDGQVVAAAFGVFNPDVVVACVDLGWSRTDATTICAARDDGGIGQLRRILGDAPDGIDRAVELLRRATDPLRPEGRPLFAGLRSLEVPSDPLGAAWRLGDLLREFRGDAHVAAWSTAGLDATEVGLLTELYWGLPMRTYVRTRAWSADQLDAAEERLVARGLVADGAFTASGRELREEVEERTDAALAPALAALGDDLDELIAILRPWGESVRTAGGYPADGPHDLASSGV